MHRVRLCRNVHSRPHPQVKRLLVIGHPIQLLNPHIDALLDVLFRLQDTRHRINIINDPSALSVFFSACG